MDTIEQRKRSAATAGGHAHDRDRIPVTFREEGPVGKCDSGSIPINLYETEDELLISAELAGAERRDVKVRVEGDCLSIRATKHGEGRGTFARRTRGELSRRVTLPAEVDRYEAVASVDRGILGLVLPKAPPIARRQS